MVEVLSELEEFTAVESLETTRELLMDTRMAFLNEIRQQDTKIKNEIESFSVNSTDSL